MINAQVGCLIENDHLIIENRSIDPIEKEKDRQSPEYGTIIYSRTAYISIDNTH
jgi:hypothetical protein